jgi:hypothetical protein
VIAPGKEPVPFVETQEETAAPMATLGPDKVVFLAGSPPNRRIAVASIASGQIIQRLTKVDARADWIDCRLARWPNDLSGHGRNTLGRASRRRRAPERSQRG